MKASRASFTLIELIVVIAIIGLAASVVAVNVHGFGREARLGSSAEMIADVVQLARTEAGASGRVWKVEYELRGRRVRLVPPEGEVKLSSRTLAGGVEIYRLVIGESKVGGAGWKAVEVRPDGLITPHCVYIRNDSGDVRSVAINPVTGAASIFDKEVEPGSHVSPAGV